MSMENPVVVMSLAGEWKNPFMAAYSNAAKKTDKTYNFTNALPFPLHNSVVNILELSVTMVPTEDLTEKNRSKSFLIPIFIFLSCQ